MKLEEFKASLSDSNPPGNLAAPLQALWAEARGEWDEAHELVQDASSGDGAWVHAYLHRKEGDQGNAAYWYSRARKQVSALSLEEEWEEIAAALLAKA